MMRSYEKDSPQAMARIVALAMLVDGGLDKSELELVAGYGIVRKLGLSEDEFESIVHILCEDILTCGTRYGQIEMTMGQIDSLLGEIEDPQLRKLLLAWMVAIVDADQRVSDGEAVLISRALERWTLDLVTLGDARMSEVHPVAAPEFSGPVPAKRRPSILETHY
jgi:uncharacterized tellurite resistance protein B-like protein